MFSCLIGLEVTHKTMVREAPGSIPDSANLKDCLWVFTFFFVPNKLLFLLFFFAIPFAMFIHLLYCKMCDRLEEYQDIKLAS